MTDSTRPASLREVAPAGSDITHGTRWGYNRGCRCSPCRKVNADYRKSHRNSEYGSPPNVDRKSCLVCGVVLSDHPMKACWREIPG